MTWIKFNTAISLGKSAISHLGLPLLQTLDQSNEMEMHRKINKYLCFGILGCPESIFKDISLLPPVVKVPLRNRKLEITIEYPEYGMVCVILDLIFGIFILGKQQREIFEVEIASAK